ncbi:DUF4389 domain-containing protein [Microbulbifer sp. CAU 1566]|uniref:DUF4389 domain-containing protein n=1 Tax=Microbulbifer sp. CAU 1566 TaxID=2933269 RepID=UPI0020044FD1|nr:DUF4389 domain-containing protein [Microbulbifer sp. CAU 1566]MCK7595796.1 DUF4389 domain-containing protein [Microbulbifer sp. CAU 1566]
MSNEELKQNLTSTNQWVRLIYMVLFAVLLEIAGFVMLAVVIAQFLFAIFTGNANDNLRRLGDQIASYIYQTLQFLIYNSEEKPFPFSEWPESEEEDLSSYASAEEIDGEVIGADADADEAVTEAEVVEEAEKTGQKSASKPSEDAESSSAATEEPPRKAKSSKKVEASGDAETVIELGSDASAEPSDDSATESTAEKSSGDK